MIKIRAMKKSDVPYVCDIQQSGFGERTPDDFDKCIDKPELYLYGVAEDGYIIVGYFGMMFSDDGMEILTICVDEGRRHQGVGTLIFKAMLEIAKKRKIKNVFLEVSDDNQNAIKLYSSFGFEKYLIRKKYYGKTDAILMKKIMN